MFRLKSKDSGFSSKIGTFPPNSGRLATLLGILACLGACSPVKKIEILGLQTAGNALKLSILPSPRYFCIILNLLRSHKVDLFGSWRRGGGGGDAHPAHFPAYGPVITSAIPRIFFNVLEICQKQFVVIVNVIKI